MQNTEDIRYVNRKWFMNNQVYVIQQGMHMPIEEHYHDFVEIVYMFRGKCVHMINDVEYPVAHGDLLVINYDQKHAAAWNSGAEFFNILMKPEFISANLDQPENAFSLLRLNEFEDFRRVVNEKNCRISFAGEERNALENLIFSLKRELDRKDAGWYLAVKSQLNLLLITLFRKMALPMDSEKQGISSEMLDYIRSHCAEKLSLSMLAERYNYNVSYFSRLFRQYTNMTMTQYIKNARIEKACYLLKQTDERISDIYMMAGYSDKTRFFRDFKEMKGVSPLEYRKNS